mgnify:FL=1
MGGGGGVALILSPNMLNSIITATEILKKPLLFFIPIIVKPSILKIIFLFDSIIFVLGKHNTVYLNLQELCLLRKPYNIYNIHNQWGLNEHAGQRSLFHKIGSY